MEEKKFVTAEELEAARLEVIRLGGPHKKTSSRFGIAAILTFVALFIFAVALITASENNESLTLPGVIISIIVFIICGVLLSISSKHQSEYLKYLNPYNLMYKMQFLPAILEESFDTIYAFEPKTDCQKR
jgi:steroid 5-alpha reductase family enzyme